MRSRSCRRRNSSSSSSLSAEGVTAFDGSEASTSTVLFESSDSERVLGAVFESGNSNEELILLSFDRNFARV